MFICRPSKYMLFFILFYILELRLQFCYILSKTDIAIIVFFEILSLIFTNKQQLKPKTFFATTIFNVHVCRLNKLVLDTRRNTLYARHTFVKFVLDRLSEANKLLIYKLMYIENKNACLSLFVLFMTSLMKLL